MKPILFNTDMTRTILDNRKTVTRRLIKFPEGTTGRLPECGARDYIYYPGGIKRPPYQDGDILYVRETWRERWGMAYANYGSGNAYPVDDVHEIEFKAGGYTSRMGGILICPDECTVQMPEEWSKWRPSIHMPKEAARIFLKVTGVRAERLRDIKLHDIEREGLYCEPPYTKEHFAYQSGMCIQWVKLWNSTIKKQDLDKYGWNANPWVWVIEFEITEATP